MTRPEEADIGSITFDSKKRLIIKNHVVKDDDVIDYFRDAKSAAEMQERLDRVLKIGVMAIKTVGVTENVDYVQKEFNKLDTKINETFETVASTVNENLEDHFGEDGKLAGWFEEHFGEDGKLVKDLLDPNKEGSPLYNLKSELKDELQRIAVAFGAKEKEQEMVQKTTLKGFVFEDYCSKLLSKIAKFYGDGLEITGKITGLIRYCKKGDFVISIGNGISKKIVLELKDGESYSLKELLNGLEEAIKNRDASYGIILVKNVNALPESVGWFNEYNGNQLVCALGNGESDGLLHEEVLYIAYKWAKAKVMMESMKERKIDVSLVTRKVETIRNLLGQFKNIKTHCSNIEKSSKTIKDSTDEIQGRISEELTEIM
jgi:hypothetical protein